MKKEWILCLGLLAIPNFVIPEFRSEHAFASGSVLESMFITVPLDHVGLDEFQIPPVESAAAVVSGTVRSWR